MRTHAESRSTDSAKDRVTSHGITRQNERTCFLLEGFCKELDDDVIEVAPTDASVAHCG